jgi:hypothetical protein
MDLKGTLFLTEGQVEKDMPIRDDCYYILHNCNRIYPKDRRITIQVYVHDVLAYPTTKINAYTFYDEPQRLLYQPWATDLLPHEIGSPVISNDRCVYWVGSYGIGIFGNKDEIDAFKKACSYAGISFEFRGGVSDEEHRILIQKSYLAPQICGAWQAKQGYIPCRIFKNISYGKVGITNSEKVQEVFDGQLIYNPDTYNLFFDAEAKKEAQNVAALMKLVKEKHTYVSRIQQIFEFLFK